MRDYPCLKIDNAKLSLVYPYTLNDRLITDFTVGYERDYSSIDFSENNLIYRNPHYHLEFSIENDDDFCIRFSIPKDQLNYQCRNICGDFYETHREDVMSIYNDDYREFNGDYNTCMDVWIRECAQQVRQMLEGQFSFYSNEYDRLKNALRRQERYDAYNPRINFVNGSSMPSCSISLNRIYDNRGFVSYSWDNLSENKVKLIHRYDYIPEYKKWYAAGENPNTTLLLGAEIEVDEGGETDTTAEAVLKIMHNGEFKEDKMFAVHDGSLNKGIEFVTMPCSLNYHKTAMPYRKMFKYLDEHGYKGHDSQKAGLHIHINRDFFKNNDKNINQIENNNMIVDEEENMITISYYQQFVKNLVLESGTIIDSIKLYLVYSDGSIGRHLNGEEYTIRDNVIYVAEAVSLNKIMIHALRRVKGRIIQSTPNTTATNIYEQECIGKLMYIIEKFGDEMSAISRRDCRYSKLLGYNGEKCKELYSKGYKTRDKYAAVNLLHTDTIEIRIFKSTLKYETFINTLEFVSKLAYFVKDHTEEEVENMTWADLMNTFSDNLKSYYLQRKEIESKKKAEKEIEIDPFFNTFVEARDIAVNDRNVRVYFNDQEFTGVGSLESTPVLNERSRDITSNWNNCREASFVIDDLNLEALYQSFNATWKRTEELQTVDSVKKRIKDIKQQMKHEKNYIAKKNLETMLQGAKIKLKELKQNTN